MGVHLDNQQSTYLIKGNLLPDNYSFQASPYRNDKVVQACNKIVTRLQQGCVQ